MLIILLIMLCMKKINEQVLLYIRGRFQNYHVPL